MSNSEKPVEPKALPRLVCAFAGLFALAIPAFSVTVGAGTQAALGEITMRQSYADTVNPVSVAILDACQIASWGLLAVGVIAALSLFSLMRKNSSAGTLRGAGRITLALAGTGALSAFYLAALIYAAAFSVV
ncbi:MAG: hypothetical protein J6L64_03620 [Opitutales bacterium]|nr:hypothetical protein [Opitutales bacterium]